MAQHDMNIANQGFPATRADLNNALQALATNSSGTSAPSTTFANQWWYDTTNNKLYIRNEANNAWIQVAVLDQTNNEWQITTGQITAGDSDGLVFKTDDGNTRITLSDGGDVTFADGTDVITASAGTDNVRIGEGAGDSIASGGNNNVLIGKDAGTAITTADNNTAVGYQAGYANTTAQQGTFIGEQAGYSNTTGIGNTFVGSDSGYLVTTGTRNQFFGKNSGESITTGSKNTIIGSYNGNQGGLDIRTSNNNIVLSDGDGNPRVRISSDGDMMLGKAAANDTTGITFLDDISGYANSCGRIILNSGNSSALNTVVFQYNGSQVGYIQQTTTAVSYNTSSDHRLKENVVELTGATTRLKQLEPKRFNFIADADTTVDGFLAHEVQTVVPEAITGTHNEVDADGNPVYQGIDQSKLVPLLVATIKELEARITALENA